MLSVDNLYSDGTETLTYGAAQNSQMLQLQASIFRTYTYGTSVSVPTKTLKVCKIHCYNDIPSFLCSFKWSKFELGGTKARNMHPAKYV